MFEVIFIFMYFFSHSAGSRIQGKSRLTNLSAGQLSLVTMGVTRPTVTVVSKPSTPIATTVTIPKPTFQLSTGK
jgi:hypothetical protein